MKVLVIAGSSGGHIFPALSFLEALKEKYAQAEILFLLPEKSKKTGIIINNVKVKYIPICSLKPSFNRVFFRALPLFFKGVLESLAVLIQFKPDIAAGFGGIESVPIILFAWLFRIKTLIHEQNVIPGRANKLLAKFSDKITVSFEETKNYLGISEDRIALTGNPLRRELRAVKDRAEALNFFGFEDARFNVLVVGGSQGSHKINKCILEAVLALPDKDKLQIIHICGMSDYASLVDNYKVLNIKIKLFSFLKEMRHAYSIADLVISRAGATTISELLYFKVPALLIPYPFAYGHQTENARILEKMGSAVIIDDGILSEAVLRNRLSGFINNPEKLKTMRSRFCHAPKIEAQERLVDTAISIL